VTFSVDAALRVNAEVERRITALLQQIARGCELWEVVAALTEILEEVL